MFIAKKQNPVVLLLGVGAVMVVMFMMLQNLADKTNHKEDLPLPEKGNVFHQEDDLGLFLEKSTSEDLNSMLPAIKNLSSAFLLKKRSDLLSYLSLDLDWNILMRAPYKYIGSMLPFPMKKSGKLLESELDGFREFEVAGQKLWVYFKKPSDVIDGASYMDFIFLGLASLGGEKGWVGLAPELYHYPEGGLYPKMKSDDIALNEIVDEMENKALHREVQKVSSLALKHYFGKVQRKEFKDTKIMDGIGYSELMQQPDRYRGGIVEFTGSLIHVERKKLPLNELKPGMEFYYQGYLLNSDRILFLFRSLTMPKVELRKIMTVQGYFLQRYNFENKLKRATWVPLLIATDLQVKQEKGIELTSVEKNGVITFVIAIVLMMIWALFRTNKINKKLRVKKSIKRFKNK